MKFPGTSSLLVIIIISSIIVSGLRINAMRNQINELQLNHVTLQTNYNNLQSGYNKLDSNYRITLENYNLLDANYNTLQSNFNYLQADLQSLRADYNSLEAEHESLESEYNKLKSEVSTLRLENNQLERENSELQSLIDEYEKVPHSYYSTDKFEPHRNTWERLTRFLSEFRLPAYYELDVFDCSESAAYVEWALENAGFMAEIVVGPSPSGEAGVYHAWVIVQTIDYQVAVEATALTGRGRYVWLSWERVPGVIYSEDTLIDGWENYYEGYDDSFKNIYMAIRQSGTGQEWDWWEAT